MNKTLNAAWIGDPQFFASGPLDVLHKELADSILPSHSEELRNHHMLFRRSFDVDTYESATIDISADDYYKLFVNGTFVGQGPAPGYHFRYFHNRFDIAPFLKPGRNVLAVHVYYQGLINRVWNSGDYRQGMIAELSVDGELAVKTDDTWKCARAQEYVSGGTTGYDTQFLENIDERKAFPGWREELFDDSAWDNASVNGRDDHVLHMQPTPPVEVYTLRPEQVSEVAPGHLCIDFGHEITGQFRVRAKGSSGERVEIRCGEELGDAGTVRYEMRCNCRYQEFWTLSGRDRDTLEFYDYKGFRYVEVIGPPKTVDATSCEAVVRHYPLDETACTFTSSSGLLNDIWTLCARGVKYGIQERYLDCPTREKGQYLGDLTVTGHSHMYLSGDLRLHRKAIDDFAQSRHVCPGIMAVAPGSFMQEIADYSLQWPMQLLRYYQHSGDRGFLEQMYPIAEALLEYFRGYAGGDGLLEHVDEKWNLVDWPANLRDGYDFELSKPVGPGRHNVINAFYVGMLDCINEIRDILGIDYTDGTGPVKEAFVRTFLDRESGLYVDAEGSHHSSLHANAIPLFFGLVPEEAKPSVTGLIRAKGLSCGVYIAYFVLKGLARAKDYDAVYRLLTDKGERSWANMIREGASTCMEAWGKDQKWNTSLCHPWASAPIAVLIEDIAGLSPASPGWEAIRFSPRIPEELDYLDVTVPTRTGKIRVVSRGGTVDIEAPAGIPVTRS